MTGPAAERLVVGGVLARPESGRVDGPAVIDLADGRIAAVETGAGGGRRIALPALANAHDHGRGLRTLAFGAVDDALELWIGSLRREPRVDPWLRAAVAFARMAESGIGAANHCHNTQDPDGLLREAEAVSRAARDVGIRIAFAVPISDRNPLVYGDAASLLEGAEPGLRALLEARARPRRPWREQLALVDEVAAFEHPLFQVQYGPVGPQWVSDEALEAVADASARTGRRVHMHLFETRLQRDWADAAYPQGLLRALDGYGLLSPRLTVAHGVWLRPADCALMAERGVAVSVNVSSNLRLRSGLPPVADYLAAGLDFGVGLDGMALDDDEDGLREVRLAWLLSRGSGIDPLLDTGRMLRAALVDGRRSILGEEGGGRIVPGAPADVLVLDLDRLAGDIAGDVPAVDLMMTRMRREAVDSLHVAGRRVVDRGRTTGVDRPAIESALAEQARSAGVAAPEDPAVAEAIAAWYRGRDPDRPGEAVPRRRAS